MLAHTCMGLIMPAESPSDTVAKPLTWTEIQSELFALGWSATAITVAWLGVALVLFWKGRLTWRRIWPKQRFFAVSWSAFQVAWLALLGLAGSSLVMHWTHRDAGGQLFGFVLAKAVECGFYVLVPIFVLRIPAYQLGLLAWRWREDVVLGALLWIPALCITWAVFLGAALITPVREHELVKQFQAMPSLLNGVALTVAAVVLAPMAEEVLFRGFVLRTMAGEPFWADLTVLVALVWAIVQGYLHTTWGPVLFLVTVGPGYLLFEWLTKRLLPRPGLSRAVYASSLLFAAVHWNAWPAPIPLFFLALFLGLAAARTQTLLAPFLLHAAFNATTVLALLGQ
jgi:membrane protease YdiL (CAAX protease family)